MADVVTPIVHLNGTSREALLDNLARVGVAVRDAQRALAAAAPHGRDYYPEPGRYDRALAQHRQRCEHLASVLASLQAEYEAIMEED